MAWRAAAFDRQGHLNALERRGVVRALCRVPRRPPTLPCHSIELPNGGAGVRHLRWRAEPLTSTGRGAHIGAGR
jgi:hypothetical protein